MLHAPSSVVLRARGGLALLLGLLLLLPLSAADAQNLRTQTRGPAVAQPAALPAAPDTAPATGARIERILVEGNQRIEAATVLSYLTVVPGDTFDAGRVDQSLKRLYGTGLFADVVIRRQGEDLVISVVENPVINQLAFEGNRRVPDETLQSEVQLKPRQVYTRARVQQDVQRILQIYRRAGRFNATVEPKVIQLPQNRVDLVFEIDEGGLTEISSIRFIGNRVFSDSRLREAISTKESAWWRFLTSDDTYDPDRLTFDRELLRRFYLSRGYADFRVLSATAELAPNRESFYITFTVSEGEKYNFGAVDVASQIEAVDPQTLLPLLTTKEGETYDAGAIETSIEAMTFELGNLGYAFVDIRPELNRNAEALTVGVTYVIEPAPRVYVERINISGNVRTLDQVVRREFRLAEGDAFNSTRLNESRRRIRGLNFFNKVEITQQRGTTPDKVVIDVEVEEKSTGELSLGGGFSTRDGIIGDVGLRERNLLGRGQDLRVGLALSFRRQQFDIGFTEPYFLGREVAAGFDVFRRRTDEQDISGFTQLSTGLVLRATYPVTEHLSQQVSYRLQHDVIEDVDDTASIVIKEQEGGRVTSAVGQTLSYDRRDDRIEPTSGYLARASTELAGFGGSERFFTLSGSVDYYIPVMDEVVVKTGIGAGNVFGLGQDITINNRFFLGGSSLRGFEYGGLGPRDLTSNDSLGGNTFYKGTVEATFPVGLPNEFGIKGAVFTDAGSVFNVDSTGTNIVDQHALRASVGFGLSWKSPFGPIRVDFGFPVKEEDYDKTQLINFSFGTRF